MSRGKKYRPEGIIPKLREAEVLISQNVFEMLEPYALASGDPGGNVE